MSGTSPSFDVIVVGGGPAGSAAAITCRQHGLSTLLLEAEEPFRERPGESLHPSVERLFQQLEVASSVSKAGFLRHKGHFVGSDAGRIFRAHGMDEHGEWRGYQAIRRELDQILLERAAMAGAVIRRPARAAAVFLENGSPAGIQTTNEIVRCRHVLDAAGGAHWLQNQLGLPVLQVSDTLVARYGWAEAVMETGAEPVFQAQESGWRWDALIADGRRAWVGLNFEDTGHAEHGSGCDVTWRLARPCAARGYFLVGDAAYVLDPASSHGVLKALSSGIAAGRAAVEIHSGQDESLVIAAYCRWLVNWFCSDALALARLYSEFKFSPSWLPAAVDAIRYISMNPL